jgi:hypothetical protein
MTLEQVRETIKWARNNINIHNTQLPEEKLDMLGRSTPEKVSDEFLKLGLIAYAVKEGINKDNREELSDDKSTLYVSKLYFAFVLERLRRYKVIEFEPVNIFDVEQIEQRKIKVIGEHDFIEKDMKGKTVDYKDFVNVFW